MLFRSSASTSSGLTTPASGRTSTAPKTPSPVLAAAMTETALVENLVKRIVQRVCLPARPVHSLSTTSSPATPPQLPAYSTNVDIALDADPVVRQACASLYDYSKRRLPMVLQPLLQELDALIKVRTRFRLELIECS